MGKYVLAIRQILHAHGYPQPISPIFCDNLCAVGIANDDIKMKRMKYVDIKYHWLRHRVRSKDLSVLKISVKTNVNFLLHERSPHGQTPRGYAHHNYSKIKR